jgi:transketolase
VFGKEYDPALYRQIVNTIRMMAVDAVQRANSGHPGMPMGMAECAFVLWDRFLQFNPLDPDWINRDRFILSAGHGSMLLYTMLHLTGYDISMDDLQNFRQWGSRTPGHPEKGCVPGVETTTGPLGQGFGNGVGMAIAQRMLQSVFPENVNMPLDHKIYGIVGDGDLMEGISSEAASMAGHLELGNLIYIYDNNHITIEGQTRIAFSEDVEKRFEALGWHTISIDGHAPESIRSALDTACLEDRRPSLIIAETHIGYGSPNKQDRASVHGSPLGEDEVKATKKKLGWPLEPKFHIPGEVAEYFQDMTERKKRSYEIWTGRFSEWQKKHPDWSELLKQYQSRGIPDDLEALLLKAVPEESQATRTTGGKIIQRIVEAMPWVCGGSADLAPSTKTWIETSGAVSADDFTGRNIHFGIREHAMGAVINGMALYGCWIPFGSTFLVFSDYMRPSIRLAALMELPVIYVFTHDSIFVGEDGPTHQPVEQLAALRAIPGLNVWRPADGVETALAWSHALRRRNGPSALCLSRQKLAVPERGGVVDVDLVYRGGYVISDDANNPDLILAGTGSEVGILLQAKFLLKNLSVRVVSIPCLDIFLEQEEKYQRDVLPEDVPTIVVEAGISQSWRGVTPAPARVIGIDRFGASAPHSVLAEKFGLTGALVAEEAKKFLNPAN